MKIWMKSFSAKLMTMILVGMSIVTFGIFAAVTIIIREEVRKLKLETLAATTVSLVDGYDNLAAGDYTLKDGELYKGDLKLTSDWMDGIHHGNEIHFTLFYDDTRVLTTVLDENGQRLVGTKAGDAVIQAVLKEGKEYSSYDVIINGEQYVAYYMPLKNSDGSIVGMAFSGLKFATVQKVITSVISVISVITVSLFILCIIIGYLLTRVIGKGIKSINAGILTLSEGSLDVNIHVPAFNKADELGVLKNSTLALSSKLKEIISVVQDGTANLKKNSDHLSGAVNTTVDSSQQILQAINEVATGATSQANDTNDAMANIEELAANLDMISGEVNTLNNLMTEVADSAANVHATMVDLVAVNETTKSSMDGMIKQIRANAESVSSIGTIIQTIQDITSQTNLLSLNASIEAARAGEAGKGFAVVADSIGKLALQSSEASDDINNIIHELVSSIETTSEMAAQLEKAAGVQVTKLNESAGKVKGVTDQIKVADKRMEEITANIDGIETVKSSISDKIASLSAMSEENSASAEETTASTDMVVNQMDGLKSIADQVLELANTLEEAVSYFS